MFKTRPLFGFLALSLFTATGAFGESRYLQCDISHIDISKLDFPDIDSPVVTPLDSDGVLKVLDSGLPGGAPGATLLQVQTGLMKVTDQVNAEISMNGINQNFYLRVEVVNNPQGKKLARVDFNRKKDFSDLNKARKFYDLSAINEALSEKADFSAALNKKGNLKLIITCFVRDGSMEEEEMSTEQPDHESQ